MKLKYIFIVSLLSSCFSGKKQIFVIEDFNSNDIQTKWRGIPTIEKYNDKEFTAWYTGAETEQAGNFIVIAEKIDNTWHRKFVVRNTNENYRVFDPVLWKGDDNVLRLFWANSYEWYDGVGGVWFCEFNKGKWSHIQPGANPVFEKGKKIDSSKLKFKSENYPEFWKSNSLKESCRYFTSIRTIPDSLRTHDEHMIIQLQDSSYYCLVRAKTGILKLNSKNGIHWTKPILIDLESTSSKFFIRRLQSGNILLIMNNSKKREKLTAFISDDECKSWKYSLIIDERLGVSYPDAVETSNGEIVVVYDRNRTIDKEILIARFYEEDILRGNKNNVKKEIVINE